MGVEIVSNREKVEKAIEKRMKLAAKMIGGTLEGHAKEACPVDTGLLRNSITYALGGDTPHNAVYSSDNGSESGHYEGIAPTDDDGEITVYVGTNVEYAPYIELGHKQEIGRFVPAIKKRLKKGQVEARAFLRPAMENSKSEVKMIIRQAFDGM